MRPFIIAELSANHNGSIGRAHKIIDAAADSGADAVKFQTWTPESMCLVDYVLTKGPWKGRYLKDLYREAWTPWKWHKELFEHVRERGLIPFSSPFDSESVDFLEDLGCPIYKIASFELVDLELIKKAASTGKRLFLSTGMATIQEIDRAYESSQKAFSITLFKCTSAYPAKEMNLLTLKDMQDGWDCPVGLSDHSPGIGVSVAAVALGASVIEKHLTLNRQDGGLDATFSMEPHEFKDLVSECHRASKALGEIAYGPTEEENTSLRRSLYFSRDMKKGEIVTEDCLVTARPALGSEPYRVDDVVGTKLTKSIKQGDACRF